MKLNTMRRCLFRSLWLVATAGFVGLSAALAGPPVHSVAKVDLQRFAGQWFELAHLPNRLQADCVSDTTATYHPQPDGSVEVVNRCREGLEKWNVAEGRAFRAKGDTSGARLKVTFLPDWLQWIPLGRGDYWVVMLDPDYRYTVVSEPSRKNLWIMSRTQTLDPALYKAIVESLRAAGYPVDKLIRTPHQPPPAAGAWLRLMV
jgi:apolipoprotein D and lipocalin family protein